MVKNSPLEQALKQQHEKIESSKTEAQKSVDKQVKKNFLQELGVKQAVIDQVQPKNDLKELAEGKQQPAEKLVCGVKADLKKGKGSEIVPSASIKPTTDSITADSFEAELPKFPTPEAVRQKQEILNPQKEEPKYEITVLDKQADLAFVEQQRPLTLEEKKQKIDQTIELLNYAATHALTKEDFWLPPQGHGKKALTRTGINKLAVIFGISTETIKIEVVKEVNIKGKEDVVAYATVKATRPNGSFVIIMGNKALSEYESDRKDPKEWVNIQTLKGTAETRALGRAVQNAIGFVPKDYIVATKEEMDGGDAFQQ